MQAESRVPPDAQWATEPDLDELRDDATTKVLTEDALPANHVLYASAISSSVPSSAQDIPLPTCDLLSNSPSIGCNPSNSVSGKDSSTRSSIGAGRWWTRRPRVARTWARNAQEKVGMIERLVGFALAQRFMVCLSGLALLFGGLYAFHILDVFAYRSLSPMIEVITQYPGWSGEQMERAITLPIEIALQGMPGLSGNPFAVDLRVERYQSLLRFRHRLFPAIDRFSTGFSSPCCRRTCSRPFRPGPPSPKSSAMNSPATMS